MSNFDRGMWVLCDLVGWMAKILSSPIWLLGYIANKREERKR